MKRSVLFKWTLYFLILVLLYRLGGLAAFCVETLSGTATGVNDCVVVIDPGHGGPDPGKVGIRSMAGDAEVLEKDVNLQIAWKLKTFLEQGGIQVHMTREEDVDLSSQGETSGSTGKKAGDMSARVAMINALEPDLTVSIHQNSFPEQQVKGGQIFYHAGSTQGKKAADVLQRAICELQTDNHRQPKANDDYYLLVHTNTPTVIAECGFLTNPEECELLCKEEYREQVAWKLYMGIVRYLRKR